MTEFAFEGGYRGEKTASDMIGKVRPIPIHELAGNPPSFGRAPYVGSTKLRVSRKNPNSFGPRWIHMGEIDKSLDTTSLMGREVNEEAASRVISKLRGLWGPGHYKVATGDGGNDFVVIVGEETVTFKKEEKDEGPAPEHCPLQPPEAKGAREFEIGQTVWIRLSRRGPFQVIGRYRHPLGNERDARHPDRPENSYERVRVDDLWLCEDSRGNIHILTGGSLTDVEPEARFKQLFQAASWCWEKREVALWVALAGTIAKLALA
jgi:hypothetical protein